MCIKVTNNTSPISSWTLLRETAGPRALWKEIDVIEKMLERCDRLDDCYWICAFCVNQHAAICDHNHDTKDSLTGLPHPLCDCGLPKHLGRMRFWSSFHVGRLMLRHAARAARWPRGLGQSYKRQGRVVACRLLVARCWLPSARFLSQASGPEGDPPGWAGAAAPPADAAAGAAAEPELLYALPLFRKPAFPGFYHVIQDSPQSETAAPLLSLPPTPQTQQGEKKTRKDTGKVASSDALMEVGTKLQVVTVTLGKNQAPSQPGGSLVVMPMQRIRRVGTISNPVAGVPLCAVETVPLPVLEVPTDESETSIEIRALNHEMVATMKDLLKMQFVNKEQFEQVIKYYNLDDPLKLADLAAGMSSAPRQDLQEVLTCEDAAERLRKVLLILKKERASWRQKCIYFVSQVVLKFILMQQLRYIKRELNLEWDGKQSIITAFKESIKKTLKIPVVTEGAEQGLSLSETPLVCGPRDRPFTAKIVFLGTQKPLKEREGRGRANRPDGPFSEMNLTNFSTPAPYAPPAEEPRLVPPALRVKQPRYIPPPEVGESFWQPEAWFQIELMHDATQCLSRVADNVLMIEPCARVDAAEFQNQHFTLQRLSWCNGDQTAYQVRLGDRHLGFWFSKCRGTVLN
eukprot:g19251.t1